MTCHITDLIANIVELYKGFISVIPSVSSAVAKTALKQADFQFFTMTNLYLNTDHRAYICCRLLGLPINVPIYLFTSRFTSSFLFRPKVISVNMPGFSPKVRIKVKNKWLFDLFALLPRHKIISLFTRNCVNITMY